LTATEPFDRTLPSPIAAVLELRASSRDSVVVSGDLTPVQERMRVLTDLEARLLDELDGEDPPAFVVLTGSSGGGKSMTIDAIEEAAAGRFERVIKDATHAESPDREQQDSLSEFFSPLRDGAPRYSGKPRLIAMNTGMVIRFFDQLGPEHSYAALEATMRRQLELPPPARDDEVPLAGRVLVVNLDQRPTAGGDGYLFARMLAKLDPGADDGIMGGAARCATCTVREWCFVRTNATIISSEPARASIDAAAAELSLDRARYLQPRALWDLAASLVTGDEPFADNDPCDRIAEIAAVKDGALVWRRLICNGPFADPTSRNGSLVHRVDPSYTVADEVHGIVGRTGINPADDSRRLKELLGGEGREAVDTAAAAIEAMDGASAVGSRGAVARGMARAAALAGTLSFAVADVEFARALAQYSEHPGGNDTDALLGLAQEILAPALARAFGEEVGVETYFRTEAYDPRRTYAVLVHVDIRNELDLPADPRKTANPDGSRIVAYRPLAVTFNLAGVRLDIDLPLYRLLRETLSGTLASSADLERFYWLRRAADALGQVAAGDHNLPLLIKDGATGERFRLAQSRDLLGREILGVRPVFT
jgi:hypothetical protein